MEHPTNITNAGPSISFAVLGAGGVGGWFGGALALAGHHVTLLARGPHLDAIRGRGIELRSPSGVAIARPEATDDPTALGTPDVVLVSVKAYSLAEVAPVAAALGEGGSLVLPLLNGVDAADQLATLGVPIGSLAGGLTVISAARIAPGVVERRSAFQRIVIGTLAGGDGGAGGAERATRLEAIARAFREAGAEAIVSPHIEVDLWNKFAFLAPIAAACGLARAPVGAVRAAPLGALLLARAVDEVTAIAAARGIPLAPDVAERTVAAIHALPAEMRPSLLLDLERGGPTEVEVLSGAVTRMGREFGIPTPVHDSAYAAIGAATGLRTG
jgi:2-dehydropantoate 2-reductase